MSDRIETPTASETPEPETGRRRLLKALTVSAGAAAAASLLPKDWMKPLLDAVVVPVHAQATSTLTISDFRVIPISERGAESPANVPMLARFNLYDRLGMFMGANAYLWLVLQECGPAGGVAIPVYNWTNMTAANGITVTGNAVNSTVSAPVSVPPQCTPALTIATAQVSDHVGSTSRLTLPVTTRVVSNTTTVW